MKMQISTIFLAAFMAAATLATPVSDHARQSPLSP